MGHHDVRPAARRARGWLRPRPESLSNLTYNSAMQVDHLCLWRAWLSPAPPVPHCCVLAASAPLSPFPELRRAPAAGKLIYTLYGQRVESAFVRNWGTGLGLHQVTTFQDPVQASLQARAARPAACLRRPGPRRRARPLDSLHSVVFSVQAFVTLLALDLVVTSPAVWFEDHLDFLSVQSTLLHEAGGAGRTWWRRMRTHITFYGNSRSA